MRAVSRQERTVKRTKKAAVQAQEVIEVAYTNVRCKECRAKGKRFEDGSRQIKHEKVCSKARTADGRQMFEAEAEAKAAQKPAVPRQRRSPEATPAKASSGGTVGLSAECKRLRDAEGMAWWRIGWELKLPGSANNVREGKSGAAQARKLYAQANGGKPHEPATRAARERAVKNPKHAANLGSKTDRKITLVERGHVIPTDTPNEEVLAMVRGRTIEWAIDVRALAGGDGEPHWLNQEARVHPDEDCVVLETDEDGEPILSKDGSRVIRFREYMGRDQNGNAMSGPTRTVRVNRIHTVR